MLYVSYLVKIRTPPRYLGLFRNKMYFIILEQFHIGFGGSVLQ